MELDSNVNVRFVEHRHSGVAPGYAADAPAPARARAAEQHAAMRGLHAPGAHLVLGLRKRPRELPVEDVAARHAELVLELHRRAGLQARPAVGTAPQAVLDRLRGPARPRGPRRPRA